MQKHAYLLLLLLLLLYPRRRSFCFHARIDCTRCSTSVVCGCMCTLIVLDVYVWSAKKSGEETRDLSLFPLKTFRVTKHLMSCARNRVFAFALLSFSLVFYALRFVLFYLFLLSFFVEEVMENGIAWKKREREGWSMRFLEGKEQHLGCWVLFVFLRDIFMWWWCMIFYVNC